MGGRMFYLPPILRNISVWWNETPSAVILSGAMTAFGILGNRQYKYPLAALLTNLKPITLKDATRLIKNFVKNQEIHFRKCTHQFQCPKRSKFLKLVC